MWKLTLFAILFLFAAPARGQQVCTGNAYITDKDPKGTNVRATPDVKSTVIRVIPFNEDGVIVTLRASENGWIKISDYEPIGGGKKKVNGWVSATLLGTGGRSVEKIGKVLYAEPNLSSKTQSLTQLGDLNEIGWRLLGCSGDWVHVEQRYPASKAPLSGWLPGDSHCPNPVSTCP